MYFKKQSNRKFWSLLAFLMVLSVGIWSCAGDSGRQAEEEQTEATTEEASTDEHPSEHPEGSEHPSEHPAADTIAQDSTKQSEHPEGSEHPNN
jgi:ABC-type nickel/cobalt efflux system permease component RcnA